MGHYAVKNKVRIFRLFDEGKRPSDIDDLSVSRITLYQYYAEWRREKGIQGKRTGFAVKQFKRNASDIKKENGVSALSTSGNIPVPVPDDNAERLTRDRKRLDIFILDCIAIVDAIKRPRPGAILLPGSRMERHLADILRIKERTSTKVVFLSMAQYADIFNKWIDIAKKAESIEDFYKLSSAQGIIYEAPGL